MIIKLRALQVFLLIILFSSSGFSQLKSYIYIIPQGFNTMPLNGYGTSRLKGSLSEIGQFNPAALNIYTQPGLGVSYQMNSDIEKATSGSVIKRQAREGYPQSGAILYPYKDFRFALAFNQSYNSKLELESQYHWNNQFQKSYYHTEMHSYSLLTSYSLKDILKNNDLDLGFKITYNKIYENISRNYLLPFQSWYTAFNFSAGLIHTINFDNEKRIRTGFTYESPLKFEKENTLFWSDGTTYSNFISYTSMPYTLSFDTDINLINNLSFAAGTKYYAWSREPFTLLDQWHSYFSVLYNAADFLKTSIGLYSASANYPEMRYSDLHDNMDALYLTGGLVFNYNMFELNLTLSDSNIFSDVYRRETIFKVATSVSF